MAGEVGAEKNTGGSDNRATRHDKRYGSLRNRCSSTSTLTARRTYLFYTSLDAHAHRTAPRTHNTQLAVTEYVQKQPPSIIMVDLMSPTCADVHKLLTSANPGQRLLPARKEPVLSMLRDFVTANEDPRVSPNYRDQRPDEMDGIFKLMSTPECAADEEVSLYALKVLKILSRKQENRQNFGRRGLNAVLRLLIDPSSSRVAGEGSNVILNVCYEKENVDAILMCGGVEPLVRFLGEREDPDLQANAAGAIQSICFQEKGRVSVRDLDGVPAMLRLLAECGGNVKVQTRAIGAIHNMSSDADSIRLIRAKEGIPLVVDLLKSQQPAVCGRWGLLGGGRR